MIIVCICLAVLILYLLSNSRSDYYVYRSETATESNDDVSYATFAEGYVKYSKNGIEYQKRFGQAEWNVSVSFREPYLVTSKAYILLADKNGNSLMVFNTSGKVYEMTLKYPIVQADISDQGVVEVILQGSESHYIQVYDKEMTLIADMKSSLDETGYPLDAALSSDGTKMAVSYLAIDGTTSKTTLAVYDFSRQLQSNDVNLAGGFEFENYLIPKVSFVEKNILAAFGETDTYYYNVSDEPQPIKEVHFDEEIESIFIGDNYIGYVLDNSEKIEEGKYRIVLFSKRGEEKLNMDIDMEYESIALKSGQILAVKDNQLTIVSTAGRILFQNAIEGTSIEEIMPSTGWRRYHVIFRDKTVTMQLRLWGSGEQEGKE